MWTSLSYKTKFRLLITGGLLLLIICYRFSISKTISEYKQFQQYVQNNQQQINGDQTSKHLNAKRKKLQHLFERFGLDTLDNAKNLLSIVGNYCQQHNMILKEYKPFTLSPEAPPKILTRYILVEGNYVDCLKLVHALETRYMAGKVNSVLFKSHTDAKTAKIYLQCGIYVQNLIK